MRETFLICDRCGCNIGALSSSEFSLVKIIKKATSKDIVPVMEFDLCTDCVNNVYNTIEGTRQSGDIEEESSGSDTDLSDATDTVVIAEAPAPASEPEQETEPETEPVPKKKKSNIDHGKIRALRNAGWKVKAIAEDMGLSENTVTNSLHYHKDDVFEQ